MVVKIYDCVLQNIVTKFKNAPIESGGIIATDKDGVVCDFYFCEGSNDREFDIKPNIFNPIISSWYENGKSFAGIIHSHPNGLAILSAQDKLYAENILEANSFMRQIVMGIITENQNSVKLDLYFVRKNFCEKVPMTVI